MNRKEFVFSDLTDNEEPDHLIDDFRNDMISATRAGLKILKQSEEARDPKLAKALEEALDATINQFVNGKHTTFQVWLGVSSFCCQELNELRDLLSPEEVLLRFVCDTILTDWKILMEFYDPEFKSKVIH